MSAALSQAAQEVRDLASRLEVVAGEIVAGDLVALVADFEQAAAELVETALRNKEPAPERIRNAAGRAALALAGGG